MTAASTFLLATLVIGAPSSFAQPTGSGPRDLAKFRSELTEFRTQMKALSLRLQEATSTEPLSLRSAVQPPSSEVSSLRDQDLILLHDAFALIPGWQSIPAELSVLLPEEYLAARRDTLTTMNSKQAGSNSDKFAVNVATCAAGPGTPNGIADLFPAQKKAIDLAQALESMPTDVLSIAARIVFSDAWADQLRIAKTVEQLNAVEEECIEEKFRANTTTALDASVASRATQARVNSLNTTAGSIQSAVSNVLVSTGGPPILHKQC